MQKHTCTHAGPNVDKLSQEFLLMNIFVLPTFIIWLASSICKTNLLPGKMAKMKVHPGQIFLEKEFADMVVHSCTLLLCASKHTQTRSFYASFLFPSSHKIGLKNKTFLCWKPFPQNNVIFKQYERSMSHMIFLKLVNFTTILTL